MYDCVRKAKEERASQKQENKENDEKKSSAD
jgi:hypothetical protein